MQLLTSDKQNNGLKTKIVILKQYKAFISCILREVFLSMKYSCDI